MADESQKKVDKKIRSMERKINEVYGQARLEIEAKIEEFNANFEIKNDIHWQEYISGKITKEDYDAWFAGQMFQSNQWNAQRNQICNILHNANLEAVNIVNGGTISAFAEGANWAAYSLEHTAGVNFGFPLYDSYTVTNLIANNPQILPEWRIDQPKEYIWNKQKVNNCVTQGIIQGENINQIATRIATATSNQDRNLALTHARTSMTGAQNAGRVQRLQDAKKMGIELVKEWMATLDMHTRDSHRDMDGEQRPVGDQWHPMKFSNGCRYPGDPQGPAREVFNCRCTLAGDLKDYPEEYERYDNIDGVPIKNMSYREWEALKHPPKPKAAPKVDKQVIALQGKADTLQAQIDALQEKIEGEGADYVFSNIWYGGDKTYADWEDIKDSIPSKIEYFNGAKDKATTRILDTLNYGEVDDAIINAAQDQVVPIFNRMSIGMDLSEEELATLEAWFPGRSPDSILATLQNDPNNWLERYNKFDIHIRELNMLQTYGEEYSQLLLEQRALTTELSGVQREIRALTQTNPFGPEAYTQERLDNALWAQNPREADDALRSLTGEVWRNAPEAQRDAIYEYTSSYHKFNEPLRGIQYGSNEYLGVGNTDLNAGYANNGPRLNNLTDILNNSTLEQDMWLQRGCQYSGMEKFFGCDASLLRYGTQEELEAALLGTTPTEFGFMSCGSSKGKGFSGGIILNIYAPEGTHAMYVEPFSAFGDGAGRHWDGVSTQSSLGHELETLLQQGTQFRVVKIERTGGTLYFDLHIIGQGNQQRWVP